VVDDRLAIVTPDDRRIVAIIPKGDGEESMKSAAYRIVHGRDGRGVEHDGRIDGAYDTKEAAFEAAVGPASNAIKLGYQVSIMVEGSEPREPALGAR